MAEKNENNKDSQPKGASHTKKNILKSLVAQTWVSGILQSLTSLNSFLMVSFKVLAKFCYCFSCIKK
jgi:hypothetical protein